MPSSIFSSKLLAAWPLRTALATTAILIVYNLAVALVKPDIVLFYDSGLRNVIVAERYLDGATPRNHGSVTMRTILRTVFLTITCLGFAGVAMGQKPKIIVDQDARGPASTDMQSILMFVQSPDSFDCDRWTSQMRALELSEAA